MNCLFTVLLLGLVAGVLASPVPQRPGKGKAGKYRHPSYEGYDGGYRPHYSGGGVAGAGASASASAGGYSGTHGGLGGHGGHGSHGGSSAHSNAQSHSHTASLGLGPFTAGLGLSHAQASANSGASSHSGHGYRPNSGYYDY